MSDKAIRAALLTANVGQKTLLHQDGPLSIYKQYGNAYIAEHNGQKVGEMNLSSRAPYATSVEVHPSFRRMGIASKLYDVAEKDIGRKMMPSPLGLSDDATKMWKKRLSGYDDMKERADIVREAVNVGRAAGVGKSAAGRMMPFGYDPETEKVKGYSNGGAADMDDKAIRAAKLTAAGLLDKARARTAVTRAGGQIAPSKYLPGVPRQVHADGGKVPKMTPEQIMAQMQTAGDGGQKAQDALDAIDLAGRAGNMAGRLSGIPLGGILGRKVAEEIAISQYADGGNVDGNDGIAAAEAVAKMLREGRAKEVTNGHLDAADPQHLFKLYETGKTGMDLPMDKASRMERAKAMGFDDQVKYHGGNNNLSAFEARRAGKGMQMNMAGVHFAEDPEFANLYAEGKGAQVYPAMTKGNTLNGTALVLEGTPEADIIKDLYKGSTKKPYWSSIDGTPTGLKAAAPLQTHLDQFPPSKTEQVLNKYGVGRTTYTAKRGSRSPYGGMNVSSKSPSELVSDPTNIRSQFARFDPRLAHLSHLNAATGGRIGYMGGGNVDDPQPAAPPPADLGQAREQKQLRTFHAKLMGDIKSSMSAMQMAHQKALDAGVFDGYEVGDVLQGSAHPMRITGRYVQKWKPTLSMLQSFDRMKAKPTIIEHEGQQYIPMLRYQTGKEDVDGFQEGSAYLDGVKAAGYRKMGGLRSVKADGGRIHANKGGSMGARADFIAGNHPEVPSVVYHGTGADFHEFRPLSHFGTVGAANQRIGGPSEQHIWGLSPEKTGTVGMGVIPAHISLKNPLDVGTERDWADNPQMIRQAADTMFKSGRLDQDYLKAAEKLYNLSYDRDLLNDKREFDRQAAQALREAGHDGIIYTNNIEDPGSRSFVTLGPEQVKSTIGNQGTFDPTNPDMTKKDGGEVDGETVGKSGGGPMGDDDDSKPADLGVASAMRRFNQIDNKPPPEVEGIFNRLAAAKDAAADAHETAQKAGAFNNVQIGDVYKYKPLDTYPPVKVIGHGMVHVSRWGGINPPKYVHNDHFPVAYTERQDASKQRGSPAIELLEDRNLYDFVSGKPRAVKRAGGAVNDMYDRIKRGDGGRLSLYSKAAKIVSGMKDRPMQAADIVQYALGKGAKKTEMAHVDVPPGKATPKQVADHIRSMQPQIGVQRRGEFMQGDLSDAEVNELMGLLSRSTASMSDQEIERQGELEDRAVRYMSPRYDQYQLPGGDNYREHILTLDSHPDDQTYLAKNHWGKLANPLAHIRMSDRMIGNKKILHIEELQSDWNNDARKRGFSTGTEKKDYDDYVAALRQKAIDNFDASEATPMIKRAMRDKFRSMDPYMLAMKMGVQAEHRDMYIKSQPDYMGVPRAPYINPDRDDASEVAMKHILTEAAKGGYDGIAFTPDEAQEERWPGHTFKGIYNKKLPGMAQTLVQQHDPETENDMNHLSGWAVPTIPLSEKARGSIMQNGFTSFKRGGTVDDALALTRRFTKDGKAATIALKPKGK
jgi:hypothetical protein